ncbi:hypothetical protein [Streptomyces scopuliridis]|uniref:Uncharacterized protein n=1 Tax=Streptomyces scopuliridis TaxID=452529 RepID=A0ACD4ZSD6_9ACTN|nr:hypothetical protein [Streptomyces scopuliridis]WSC01203.1 hypothetical protein OG835_32230 [Streptomyces scopuliridis]
MSGAYVVLEEADDTGEDGLMVTRVSVNGVDVGRLARAPKIRVGTKDDRVITTVTITLVPSRLEIRGEHADGDRRESRAGFTAKIT